MTEEEKANLPCCLIVDNYKDVEVDGHREWRCGTCGKVCVELHGKEATLCAHVAALIPALDGDGSASNPAPEPPVNLTLMMDKITGVPQHLIHDFKKAVQWYHLVAEQGKPEAQVNLGVFYASGARRPMIAYMGVDGPPQDDKKAVRWFRLAAEQKNASAQFNLGVMCYTGEGVPQDIEEAARWFRLAAEQGKAVAQYNLGLMYANGKGVPQDYTEALRWLRLAADQGDVDAQYDLGGMYYMGKGVLQDYTEAMRWYRKAADQGDAMAQGRLGALYFVGKAVSQDYVQAHMWFNIAVAHGRKDAAEDRDNLAEEMTPAQIAEAEKLACEWKPKK